MKVILDREGKNVVKLGLELEPEKAMKAYELACRQLSHQVNIPGFRRGKAPRNIIEKTLGVDYIKREALDRLIPELLERAIADENLDLITRPEIDKLDFELGSPLKLEAKFEVRPEVTLGDYLGITVDVPQARTPDDSLERALNTLAESKATLAKVEESREVVTGDTVLLDFECFAEGKPVEGGKAEGMLLEVKEGAFLEGFAEQLTGHKPDEEFEVKSHFPESYRNKDLAGKEALFKVRLREIRQRMLPDINDELAKEFGQESLEELKEALHMRIGEEVEQENMMRAQRLVVDKVVDGAKVDIPDSMIERERSLLMEQLKHLVEQQGQNYDEFEKSDEFENIYNSKFDEAKVRVLTSLVLGAVVRQEKLTVNEEEVGPYLAELVHRYNVPVEEIYNNEYMRRQIMEDVLTNKVVEYLVSKAEIKWVPEEEHVHSDACQHGEEHDKEGKESSKAAPKGEKKRKKEAVEAGAQEE